MKYIFILLSSLCFSQNLKINNLIYSKEECQEPIGHTWMASNRIINSTVLNDTLLMEIQYIENCGNGKILNYSVRKDTIIFNFNFDFTNKDIADCDCVFKNKIKIKNPETKKPFFKINTTHGVNDIKLSNNYYKPKKYIITGKDSLIANDDNGFIYMRSYYKSGSLFSLTIKKNTYSEKISYFEDGKIKSIKQTFGNFDDVIYKEWDSDGKLINYKNLIETGSIYPNKEQVENGALHIISLDKRINIK